MYKISEIELERLIRNNRVQEIRTIKPGESYYTLNKLECNTSKMGIVNTIYELMIVQCTTIEKKDTKGHVIKINMQVVFVREYTDQEKVKLNLTWLTKMDHLFSLGDILWYDVNKIHPAYRNNKKLSRHFEKRRNKLTKCKFTNLFNEHEFRKISTLLEDYRIEI